MGKRVGRRDGQRKAGWHGSSTRPRTPALGTSSMLPLLTVPTGARAPVLWPLPPAQPKYLKGLSCGYYPHFMGRGQLRGFSHLNGQLPCSFSILATSPRLSQPMISRPEGPGTSTMLILIVPGRSIVDMCMFRHLKRSSFPHPPYHSICGSQQRRLLRPAGLKNYLLNGY